MTLRQEEIATPINIFSIGLKFYDVFLYFFYKIFMYIANGVRMFHVTFFSILSTSQGQIRNDFQALYSS